MRNAEVSNEDYMKAFSVYRNFKIYKLSALPRFVDFVEVLVGGSGLDTAGNTAGGLRAIEVTELGKQRIEWLLGPHAETMLYVYCAQQGVEA